MINLHAEKCDGHNKHGDWGWLYIEVWHLGDPAVGHLSCKGLHYNYLDNYQNTNRDKFKRIIIG